MNDIKKAISDYPQKNLGLLLAGVTAFCWSILAILLKYALTFTDSSTIVWSRMTVAFATLLFYLSIKNKSTKIKIFNFKASAVIAGLFLGFNYFGYMKGIELTTAGNAQVMIQLAPTFLILIGVFYFKEHLTRRQLAGVVIAMSGFVYFYKSQLDNLLSSSELATGNTWILAAALAWALFSALQKKSSYQSLHQFNIIVYLVASFALLPGAGLAQFVDFDLKEIAILVILGLNTVIAYGCFGEALKKAPASQVSLIIILNPLITLSILYFLNLFNFTFIKPEVITLANVIGATLVVGGVSLAVINIKSKSA